MVFLACRDWFIEKGTKLAAEASADNNRRILTGAVRDIFNQHYRFVAKIYLFSLSLYYD